MVFNNMLLISIPSIRYSLPQSDIHLGTYTYYSILVLENVVYEFEIFSE